MRILTNVIKEGKDIYIVAPIIYRMDFYAILVVTITAVATAKPS